MFWPIECLSFLHSHFTVAVVLFCSLLPRGLTIPAACYRVALPFPLHFNKELLSVTATLSYSLDC